MHDLLSQTPKSVLQLHMENMKDFRIANVVENLELIRDKFLEEKDYKKGLFYLGILLERVRRWHIGDQFDKLDEDEEE